MKALTLSPQVRPFWWLSVLCLPVVCLPMLAFAHQLKPGEPLELSEAEASRLIESIIEEAETYLGTPYRYGGSTRNGIDCSALMMKSFQAAGVPLLRTSRQQATQGMPIEQSELKRGDLVFFGTPSYISHVAMITRVRHGRIHFLHASSEPGKVAYGQLTSSWSRKYVTARRIITVKGEQPEEPELVFSYEAHPRSCSCKDHDRPESSSKNLAGKFPFASQRLLRYDDLKDYSKWELRVMRNEIFARKGYRFRTSAMIRYFQEQDWYQRVPKLSSNKMISLSGIEQQNVGFIRQMELR
jgi:hypothetical protein